MSTNLLKNLAYGLLDLATLKKGVARKVNNMQIRFPARWSRYYEENYEHENYALLREKVTKGMSIIDIGAHIGLFSTYTSQLAGPGGKLICLEPTPGTFAILKDTLRLNHCDNVIPLQKAAGSAVGTAYFYVDNKTEGSNANSLVQHPGKEDRQKYEVAVTTVDAICEEYKISPGIVKIDAEGAELDVLKGAVKTMQTIRPIIILGLHPPFIENKDVVLKEILDLVSANRYKVIFNKAEINEREFIDQVDVFDVHLLPA